MLTVPRLTVVYSKESVKAEEPLFSSSRSLGSERSRFSHMKRPSRSVVTPAPTGGSDTGWGSMSEMDGSSVRFSPHNSFWDCARPVSLVITEYGADPEPITSTTKAASPGRGYAMEEELDVIVNQPVSLVVDDPKAERELKKGGSKAAVSGIMWPLTWVFSIGVPFSVKTSLP